MTLQESRQQATAMHQARRYARRFNLRACKTWIQKAMTIRPLSHMQWYNIGKIIGPYELERLREEIEGVKV